MNKWNNMWDNVMEIIIVLLYTTLLFACIPLVASLWKIAL